MYKISILLLILFGAWLTLNCTAKSSAIDLSISPTRIEIISESNTNSSWVITLSNNSDIALSFILSTENCFSKGNWVPFCVPPKLNETNSGLLTNWITFDRDWPINVPAHSGITIRYSINVPVNALSGGYYGAIFFSDLENTNLRIGSLLLVTVPWNIIVDPVFWEITIKNINNWDPMIGDKKIAIQIPETNIDNNVIAEIKIPISNKWNTHIKPSWKITFYEMNWSQLRNIGKELIRNSDGTIVGEKIVDYLIINEDGSNILPGINRIFNVVWHWFAHESVNPNGTLFINFNYPWLYYWLTDIDKIHIYPWEKIVYKHFKRKFKAKIDLSYLHPVNNMVVSKHFNIPFLIEYDALVKSVNATLLFSLKLLPIVIPLVI